MTINECDFCNVTKLKVLLQMHSSLDEHLYEINYILDEVEFGSVCTVASNKFWSAVSFQNLVRLSQI
jgi:hypothetical protein